MKSILKKYKYLIVIVLFLLTIYAAVPSVNYTNCRSSERFQALTIHGVVVKKYLDKSQHSTPIIEIENFEGRVDSVHLFGDRSGLYDRIQISDTLKKKSGTNEVLTKTSSKYVRFGVADFKCDSAKLENEKFLFWVYDLFGTVPSDNTKEK